MHKKNRNIALIFSEEYLNQIDKEEQDLDGVGEEKQSS